MNHAMIDVEALRVTQPWKAPLMQIGILAFDEEGFIKDELELTLNPGMLPIWAEPEQKTVDWWEKQKYWKTLVMKMERGLDPREALSRMCSFYRGWECQTAWFNGPTYDQVMLEAYLDAYDVDAPWGYGDCRDFRTIRKQHKRLLEWFPENLNSHCALDDARHQTQKLAYITQQTGHLWK